jgi:hypothetical protein
MVDRMFKPRFTQRVSHHEATPDQVAPLTPPTKDARQLTGTYGGPVAINDNVEAEKIQGTAGRRLELVADQAGDHISRLSVGGSNTLTHRPSTKAGRPTLEKDTE